MPYRILLEKSQSQNYFSNCFYFFLYASCNIKKVFFKWTDSCIAAFQYLKGPYKKDGESIWKGKKWQDKEELFWTMRD